MSNEDTEHLKLWAKRSKEQDECDEMGDAYERQTMRDIIDNKYPMNDIINVSSTKKKEADLSDLSEKKSLK